MKHPEKTSSSGTDKPPKLFNKSLGKLDTESMQASNLLKVGKPALDGYRFFPSRYVPVSFVAQDWKVSPRRIRALLAAGRLDGRTQTNGYWEVLYPYSYIFGTRGPALKRTQKQERRTE